MKRISLFLLLGIIMFSCEKNDEDIIISDSPNPHYIKPTFLNVGTSYEYQMNDEVVFSTIDEQIGQDTFLMRSYGNINVIGHVYWVINNDVLYSSYRHRDPNSYVIECKFNADIGSSWQVTKDGGNTNFTYTIDSLLQTVTTGKGEVTDAIRIKVTSMEHGTVFYNFFSPSVGAIYGLADNGNITLNTNDYTVGKISNETVVSKPITFGSFPFIKEGNFWKYEQLNFWSGAQDLNMRVVGKDPNKNIYEIESELDGVIEREYIYEDNGKFMSYEEGESYLQADVLYMDTSIAELGYSWATLSNSSGKLFFYEITNFDVIVNTPHYGDISTTAISVGSSLYSSQTNYWSQEKGIVYVDALTTTREITDSNVRQLKRVPITPITY